VQTGFVQHGPEEQRIDTLTNVLYLFFSMDTSEMHSERELFLMMRQHVAVLFWPFLLWSVIGFRADWSALLAKGHIRVRWRVTWWGAVQITWVDKADPMHALRGLPGWERLQAQINANTWTFLCDPSAVGRDSIPPCLRPDVTWRDAIPPYGALRIFTPP